MAIFEYKCDNCNKIFEKIILNNTSIMTIPCLECNNEAKKIFSVFQTRHSSDTIRSKK
jgi:putative FmdB family regulatory protein